jgi:uncharacterized protein (TIGR00290 family)
VSTPVLLAWSGGKDSTLALARLRQDPGVQVAGLLTTISSLHDRISIHGVRRSILHAQAEALDLPLFEAPLAPESSNEDYDRAWSLALQSARAALGPIRQLAYGDLFLEDVRRFREEQAVRLDYAPLFPLWGEDTSDLARHFVREGYEAYLTCVDTTQLTPEFAGRRFDDALLADLPPDVDPCGERGEFHTCVVAGPIFRQPIPVASGERLRRDGRFEYCDLVALSPIGSKGEDVAHFPRTRPARVPREAVPEPLHSAWRLFLDSRP